MSKAQTDIRTTSFDASSHRPEGYQGTIDDVLAQIRAEPDQARAYWPLNMSRERYELLGFLGVFKPAYEMSGRQAPRSEGVQRVSRLTPDPADIDSVVYYGGNADYVGEEPSPYSLEYAMANFPNNFKVQS